MSSGFLPTAGILPPAQGTVQFSFAVPALPQLVGVTLHVQGLLEQSPAHLTAWRSLVVQ